jgi:hypothetical protein
MVSVAVVSVVVLIQSRYNIGRCGFYFATTVVGSMRCRVSVTSAGEPAACATTPMRLAPASRSARRRAENVNSMGSTLGLSAYLLKVFCKGPVQKGHVVKI